MKVVFYHTEKDHCNEVKDFRILIMQNESLKIAFPEVEFSMEKVQGSFYFMIKCFYDGKVKEIQGTALDVLSNFLKKHYNIK